jgi:hypothetical protein
MIKELINSTSVTVIGISGLISFSLMFVWIFFNAYFNGGKILVRINRVSEANFEIVLILLFVPFILLYLYRELLSGK